MNFPCNFRAKDVKSKLSRPECEIIHFLTILATSHITCPVMADGMVSLGNLECCLRYLASRCWTRTARDGWDDALVLITKALLLPSCTLPCHCWLSSLFFGIEPDNIFVCTEQANGSRLFCLLQEIGTCRPMTNCSHVKESYHGWESSLASWA